MGLNSGPQSKNKTEKTMKEREKAKFIVALQIEGISEEPEALLLLHINT